MKPAPTRTRPASNRVRSSGMHTKQVFDVHWGRRGGRKFGVPDELFEAIPKSKRFNYLGHLNDICLFVEAAKRAAPE